MLKTDTPRDTGDEADNDIKLVALDQSQSVNAETPLLLRANQSMYGQLVRYSERNHLISKWFIHPSLHPTYLFQAAAWPVESPSGWVCFAQAYVKGSRLFFDVAWPLAFSGLLMADVAAYNVAPSYRYGNSIGAIFGGTSPNLQGVSTHLGNYLPTTGLYWLGPSVLVGIPIVFGFGNALRKRLNPDATHLWDVQALENQWSDDIAADLSAADIRRLADIADTLNARTASLLPEDEARRKRLLEVGQQALARLAAIANQSSATIPYSHYVYANYQLWTLGQSSRLRFQPLFWLFSAYLYYSNFRLWELWISKFVGIVQYGVAKHQCDNDGRILTLLDEWGDYFCTVCGDWPFVFVNDRFTEQGCLDGLLASNATPADILTYLSRLQGNVSAIVFSKQNGMAWSDAQWRTFLQHFQNSTTLQQLDVSAPLPTNAWLDTAKLNALADFLLHRPVTTLNIQNQALGDPAIQQLRAGLNQTRHLDISGNALGDISVTRLSGVPLHTVRAQNNRFRQAGIDAIVPTFPMLRRLDLSNTTLSAFDLTRFWQGFARNGSNPRLIALELSNCDLHDSQLPDDLELLRLDELILQNNTLTDFGIISLLPTLPNASVVVLDISGNGLTDTAVVFMADYIGTLQHLALSRNAFSTDGLSVLCDASQTSDLHTLIVARNQLGDVGAEIVANASRANTSQLVTVDLSHNGISDMGGQYLATSAIEAFSLQDNQLTDVTLEAFLPRLSDITELNLAGNEITAVGGKRLADLLANASLTSLNLRDNPLEAEGTRAVVRALITEVPLENTYDTDLTRAIRRARPRTNLRDLRLPDTANRRDRPSLDAVLSRAGLNPNAVFSANPSLLNRPVEPFGIGGNANPISTQAALPQLLLLAPAIVIGLIALYLLYRALKPCVSTVYRFFRPAPEDDDDNGTAFIARQTPDLRARGATP